MYGWIGRGGEKERGIFWGGCTGMGRKGGRAVTWEGGVYLVFCGWLLGV